MIKDFKRVISLILVVAMLASFAGIPGIADYVPTIEAEAAATTPARPTTLSPIKLEYGNSAENGSKPWGSFAAINQAVLDVPRTLYTNGSKIVNSVTSKWESTGEEKSITLDTTLTVIVPGACYDAARDMNGDGVFNDAYVRLNIIDQNENILKVYSLGGGLDPYPNGLNDSNGNVIYPAVDSQSGAATASGSNWEVTFDLVNETNIVTSSSHKMLCYRIDYIVPQTSFLADPRVDADGIAMSELGKTKENVMYSQFAASAVIKVPNFRAGYMIPAFGYSVKGGSEGGSVDQKNILHYQQGADFSSMLVDGVKGINIQTTYRSCNNSTGVWNWMREGTYTIEARHAGGYNNPGNKSGYTSSTIYGGTTNLSDNRGSGGFGEISTGSLAQDHMGNASNSNDGVTNTMGATIYYDKYHYSSGNTLSFTITTDFLGAVDGYATNFVDEYYEMFVDSPDGPQYEFFGNNGATKTGWQSTGSNSRGGLNYQDLDDNKRLDNFYASAGSSLKGQPASDQTRTYTVNLTGSNASYNFLNALMAVYFDDNGTAYNECSNVGVGLAYHVDVVAVDRTTSYNLITTAVNNNYIKAEMDADWWNNYRNNVIFAYYNTGYLYNTSDPFPIDDDYMYAPVFNGANYDTMMAALYNTPAYDAGTLDTDVKENIAQHGVAWKALGSDESKLGDYYYTADSWATFKAARDHVYKLAFANYRSSNNYGHGYIQDFGLLYDPLTDSYIVKSETKSHSALHCYLQYEIEQATNNLANAQAALKLKTANYSGMLTAINNATDNGANEYITNHSNATYNSESLNFKVSGNDYTGTYYDYEGNEINVSSGSALSQNNFSTTTASTLREALQKRMFVYDWTGKATANGIGDEPVAFNYAHNTTFSPVAPSDGFNSVFTTDYATTENETKLAGGAATYYLSLPYQSAIDVAISNINTAAAALRLRVNPKALGTEIEAARYVISYDEADPDENEGEFLYNLQGNNDTYDDTDVYTNESFEAYLLAMKVSATAIYGDGNAHTLEKGKTTIDYSSDFSAKDTDLAGNEPAFYTSSRTMTIIDADGNEKTVTPANRQDEYNYALTNAQNAQLLLVKYADYSKALERINGTAYIPTYDQNGAQAVTGYTGETWYTAETWTPFVNARNALANILYINGVANSSGYSYSDGVANKYTRGRLTEPQEETSNTIASAVAAFDDAYSKLVLKTMAEYVDGSNNTFDAINTQVQTKLEELGGSSPVYTIVDGALDKTNTTVTNYRKYNELVTAADVVKAIASTDSLVGNKAAYESAVTAFNNKYNEVKAGYSPIDESGWLDVFEHLSVLADGTTTSVTAETILDKFSELYVDNGKVKQAISDIITEYGNAKKGTHLPEGSDVTALNTQSKINEQVEALYELLKKEENALPSARIQNTISDIRTEMGRSFVVYNPYDFSRYAGKTDLAEGDIDYTNPLYSWGDDSATVEANKHNGLSAISIYDDTEKGDDSTYTKMVGYLNTAETNNNNGHTLWTTAATEFEKVANTLRVQAGLEVTGTNYEAGTTKVLEKSKVKLDVLLGALKAANRSYGYVQNVTAVNPEENGENYAYNKFTSESVEEIRGVVQYVEEYLVNNNIATITTAADGTKTYTAVASSDKQLDVDKLVFFVLDEIENRVTMNTVTGETEERWLLSVEPTEMVDGVSKVIYHFTWTYTYDQNGVCTDAVPTLDETKFTGNYSWENLLHKKIEKDGGDNGLALAPAYYGFLDQQINTPYSEELTIDKSLLELDFEGKVDYTNAENITKLTGKVWIRDTKGTEATTDDTLELVLLNGLNGKYVGETIFEDVSWKAYTGALQNATSLTRNFLSNRQNSVKVDEDPDSIDGPDEIARKLYVARTGLKLSSFASNTTDFAQAQEWYYKDLQKYGLTTPITRYVVNENGTTSTYEENVFIYTGVDNVLNEETGEYEKGAVLSAIDAYWALYASRDTKADYDSIDAAIASRNAISGTYEDGELVEDGLLQDYNVTLKKKNDSSFYAGANDLITNFIAGTWTNGKYDSTLIAKTDADWDTATSTWKSGSQGWEIQRMLTAIEAMFTDEEVTVQFTDNTDVEKCTFSTTFGNDVAVKTNELYYYTTGQNGSENVYAQNLQFAINMRDNELYKFLGTKVGVGFQSDNQAKLVSYYYGNDTVTINNKKYSDQYFVFDQEYIEINIKNPINDYFSEPSNWPRIYQVNGMTATAAKNGAIATVTGYKPPSTTDKTGTYEYTGTTVPEEVSNKIVAILNYVGPKSPSYAKALENDAFNTFRTEHLLWLRESAFYKGTDGNEYVLADANVSDGAKPAAYSMPWYTEGKGTDFEGKQYYLYKGDTEKNPITGSGNAGWFTDDKVTNVTKVQNTTLSTINQFGIQDVADINGIKINQHTNTKSQITNTIAKNGWMPNYQTSIESTINGAQNAIDKRAGAEYAALQALVLLPATDAYRDVMELWQKSHNTEIEWGVYEGINPFYAEGQEGCPITLTEGVEATLYNASDIFISRLADLDPRLKGEGENEIYKPEKFALNDEYWYVAKTNVIMNDHYKMDDENGYYAAYEAFCSSIANTPEAEKITIDRADEVNGPYNKNVPHEQRSLLAQAIDLMAKLELTSLKYGELEEVVKAFFYNYNGSGLCANDPTFKSKYNLQAKDSNGNNINFYDYTNYINEKASDTNEPVEGSLAYVVTIMHNNGVISDALYNNAVNTNYQFILPFGDEDHKGTLYTNAKNQEEIDNARQAIVAAINKLKLKDAELDALDAAVNRGLAQDPDDYDVVSTEGAAAWDALEKAIDDAKTYFATKENDQGKLDYVIGEDGKVVPVTGLDIRFQNDIDAKTKAINDAIANLKFKADTAAPKMTVDTTPESMRMYYNVAAIANEDAAVAQGSLPETGTFIMPVKSGYSLVVYTNELNPRIAIDLQDLGITGSPLTSKPEKLSATAQRTADATANIITGTKFVSENNETTFNGIDSSVVTSSTQHSAQTYKDASASSYDENSSLFAILAPTFSATGDQKQAVLYQLTVSDSGASQSVVQGDTTPTDNKVKEITFANGEVVKLTNDGTAPNTVSVYIYYRNTMPADGNDEGIDYTGTALTAAHGGNASFVTNNIEGQKGTWQNIFGLQRSFPNIKAWELIDENKDGFVNWIYPNHIIGESTTDDDSLTKGPIYYDPNFGQMNTGSFAYVLDKNNAFDKTIIDKYNSVKTANDTDAADMDYEAATAAKNLLINGSEENEYKDKLTREHFEEIKEYASFARFGSYQYWSQGLNGKYENGDLVFVHVVDRWGNVCNRIMQVSDYDGIAPEVSSNSAGTATIVEQGGSGLETVGIWQNGEQTASVQTNSAAITLNATDDVTVEEGTDLVFAQGITVKENSDVNVYENADGVMVAQVSGNKFTVDGLVPGKEYQVGACDTAGNVTAPSVLADANGNVEITVVEDEEATFSLNSDIVVTINTGISSSVIDAEVEGNVIANKYIDHIIVTKDNVTQIKVVNLADNKETVYKPASTIMYDYEDGTIGWETYYKLTEGQHSYKVYAMVDGAYEEMGVTYTFDATLKTVPLSLSVVGNGKIVLEYSGAAPANVSNFKLVNIPYGAKVTIKATSLDSNSKFYYWQNDVTNRVLNVNEEMSFTAVAAVDYDAYFTNSLCATSEYKYVVYVNNAGNVIKSVELRDGNNDYIVPLGPSLPDHEFKGWAMSKAEVIASEEDIVVVRPIYTLNAEYTVELTEGNYTVSGAGTYTAVGNQRPLVTINASAMNDAGEDFLYWIDEETKDIVSYDRAYAFNCIKNVVLTPVYGDGSSLVVEPVIRIADVRYDASSGKVSFYSQRSIGDDYILYETGIIVTRTQSIAANEDSFVLGGVSTAKGTSTSTAPYGTYSVNVSVSAQETVWARAYAVVETADGEIIEVYGDIVPYTNK